MIEDKTDTGSIHRPVSAMKPAADGASDAVAESTGINVPSKRQSHGETSGVVAAATEPDVLCEKPVKDAGTVWWCAFLVKHRRTSFAVLLAIHVAWILLTIVLSKAGYDILLTEFRKAPLELTKSKEYLRQMTWKFRNQGLDEVDPVGKHEAGRLAGHFTQLLFVLPEGANIFTPDNLQGIRAVEENFVSTTDYNNFCTMDSTGTECAKPKSIIRFFDGTHSKVDPIFDDPEFSQVSKVLETAHRLLPALLEYHIGADSGNFTNTGVINSHITRTLLLHSENGRGEDALREFLKNHVDPMLIKTRAGGMNGIDFYYFNSYLYMKTIRALVTTDLALAIGSFFFILFFMWFQTRSAFITGMATFSIIANFFATNMIYRIVLDYRYFGIFHVLSVFIILGIGADDVFVFYDTWRASSREKYLSLEHRLSACYRKAAKSMLITSATTALAFVASASSPLLGLHSFGLFSAILVIVNYLSVITFFPVVVLEYQHRWKSFHPRCFRCNSTATVPADSTLNLQPDATETIRNPVIRYLAGGYATAFRNRKFCAAVLLVFTMQLLGSTYLAFQLEPEVGQVRFLKSSSNYQRARDLNEEAFVATTYDDFVEVYLVWGLKMQDFSGCHKTDFECEGVTVYDRTFTLNPPPTQQALLRLCRKLRSNLSSEEAEMLRIPRHSVTGEARVSCFVEGMAAFYENSQKSPNIPNGVAFPVSAASAKTLAKAHPEIYGAGGLLDNFYRYFEMAVEYWLTNGYAQWLGRKVKSMAMRDHGNLIGKTIDPFNTNYTVLKYPSGDKVAYGTRLMYAAISVKTDLRPHALSYKTTIPISERWEQFMRDQVAEMPEQLAGGFQCTPRGYWHHVLRQQALVHSAFNGIIIGLSFAAVFLTLGTQNIVMGLLATLCITAITLTVVSLIPILGWRLGVQESINLCLIVGLAVDYVVHLAEAYHVAPSPDRCDRVRYMLKTMGSSVLSGACTTLGSSVFMLFGQINFFMQFGMFVFATIFFSILYAMVCFTALLSLFGPQGEFGSIGPVIKLLKMPFRGSAKNKIKCESCSGKGYVTPVEELLPDPVSAN